MIVSLLTSKQIYTFAGIYSVDLMVLIPGKGLGLEGMVRESYLLNGANTQVAPALASGTLAVAGTNGFRNASDEADIGAVAGTLYALYIGAANASGSRIIMEPHYIQAAAVYDVTISNAQVTALHDA